MTAAAVLDRPVDRLGRIDPALMHLGAALARVHSVHGELHDARWTPGQGCRLAYRAPLGTGAVTFREVTVSPRGWDERDYRDDPSMPGLTAAADPATVAGRLAQVFGPGATWSVEPVRYRPRSRCVLRYDAGMPAGTGTVYAKVFSANEFQAAAHMVGALSRVPALTGLVPRLVTVWSDLQAVVVAGAPGRSASSVLSDPALASAGAAALGRELGTLLARFHRQAVACAPTAPAEDQLTALAEQLEATRCADAHLGERCAHVLQVLGRRLPPPSEAVLAHGAFRTGQVIVGPDGRATVLDLDGVCRSDPGRDLGTLLAHLTWAGLRTPDLRARLDLAGAGVLSAYAETSGPLDRQALRWWCAVGLLQVTGRRFRRLETGSWDLTAGLVAEAEALVDADDRAGPVGGAALLPGTDHLALHARLLDPGHMTQVLGEALVTPGRPGPRPSVEAVEQLSVAAGRRSVVRYTVRGLEEARATTIVAKAFADPFRAHLLHQHLRTLSHGPFSGDGFHVPEPLGLLPDRGLVLYRSAPGTPLDRVTDRSEALRGVQGAALWLARLHTSGVVLPRAWSLAQESATSLAWAELVTRSCPELADAAHRLAGSWSAGLTQRSAPDVPLHKDFHPGHVLVGDAVCVIDLDEARHGDPAFDVAHFCAYQEAFGPGRRDPGLSAAFVECYAAASRWEQGETVAPYAAYAWLKIAKQWALGSGPCRGTSEDERRTGAARALERGLEWLNA